MKKLKIKFHDRIGWNNRPEITKLSDVIIETADNEMGVHNQLDRATERSIVLAKAMSNLLTVLYSKGVLTADEVISIVPTGYPYNGKMELIEE